MVLISEFIKIVLPEVLPCPQPLVDQAVRQSIIEFCEQTWIFKKSFNTTIATVTSTINDYADIEIGEVVTDKVPTAVVDFLVDGDEWGLKYLELEDATNYITSLREEDEKIYSFPDDSTLRVHEMSVGDEVYLEIAYKPTYEITEIDDIIYNDHVEAITAGAKMRVLAMPGQPWTNGKLALHYTGIYRRGIAKQKGRVQKSYAKESGRVKWRTFGE